MTRSDREGEQLRGLLAELAESEPVSPPPLADIQMRRPAAEPASDRRLLLAALAVVAVVLAAAVTVLSQHRGNPTTTGPAGKVDTSSVTPVLLAPGPGSPAVAVSEPSAQMATMEPRGAVAAPDGTIYSLSVDRATNDIIPGERAEIAGFEMTITRDGSAPSQIYRTIDLGCVFLTVTTVDAPATSPDLSSLLDTLTIEGTDVRFDLPTADWTSFGAASVADLYLSTLVVESSGQPTAELYFDQSPGTPLGYFLFGESAPVMLPSSSDDQLWFFAGVTTPGFNTLIGTRLGTVFRLSGTMPVETLSLVAESLVDVDSAQALPPTGDAVTPETMITQDPRHDLGVDCPGTAQSLTIGD